MKNKIISIALAVIMLVPVFSYAKEEETTLSKETKVMSAFGFLDKIDFKDPSAAVTRGEFAAAAADLIGLEIPTVYTRWFSDVDEGSANALSIAAAAQSGIIKGSDGYFYPNRQITYSEAATILVNALGYKDFANYDGAYSIGFLKVAESAGIKKQVTASGDTPVNSEMAAKLLYNAGNAQIVVPKISGGDVSVSKEGTLFWEKHKIDSGRGIITANEYTSLSSSVGAGKNTIIIGDFLGKIYFSNDPMKLLGYNVEYFYKEEDDSNTVYYIEPLDSKNEIISVSSSDIDSFDIDSMKLNYEVDGKLKSKVIPQDASVIYNGKLTINYFYTENGEQKSIFNMENGDIKLIDNNGDGKIEVVNVTAYENYFVSGVNTSEKVIYDRYDKNKSFSYENADDKDMSWILTDKEGNIADFSKIAENSVLSIAKSEDGEIMRGVVCTDSVAGKITGTRERYGDTIVEVDGTEYVVSKSFLRTQRLPSIDMKVTLYLDYTGKAAAIVTETSTSGYAFVIKKIYDDVEDIYSLKLLTADGTKKDFKFAKSAKIDGQKYDESGILVQMETFADYQVVLYKLNSKDEITMIDTLDENTGGDYDRLKALQSQPESMEYWNSRSNFYGKMLVDTDTIVFKTPPNDADVKYDYDLYSVSSLPTTDGTRLTVRGFTGDSDRLAAECIQYVSGSSKDSFDIKSPTMLVTDSNQIVNKDDEITYEISGYNSAGEIVTYVVSGNYKYDSEDSDSYNPANVKPGDVIKYVRDARDEISYIVAVKKIGESGLSGNYKTNTNYSGWFSHSSFFVCGGILESREGKNLAIKSEAKDSSGVEKETLTYLKLSNNTKIYYVSKGKKTAIEKLASDKLGSLADYKHNYQEKEVVAILGNADVRMFIMYE